MSVEQEQLYSGFQDHAVSLLNVSCVQRLFARHAHALIFLKSAHAHYEKSGYVALRTEIVQRLVAEFKISRMHTPTGLRTSHVAIVPLFTTFIFEGANMNVESVVHLLFAATWLVRGPVGVRIRDILSDLINYK